MKKIFLIILFYFIFIGISLAEEKWINNLPGPTSPELIDCLKSSIGEKNLEKYFGSKKKRKNQRPSSEHEGMMRKCFVNPSHQNINCVAEGKKINRVKNNKIIGVFGPTLWQWSRNNSFKDANEIKETGSNTAGIGLLLFINKKGELAFGEGKAPELNQYLCAIGSALKQANESGLSTYLAIIPQIMSGKKGVERSKLKGKQREVFLNELENILPLIAKFAERHAVNYFAPLSEPEKRVGTKLAVSWMAKVPKIIKPHFNGLLVWQSADDYYKGKFPKFEGGYDLFGIIVLFSRSSVSEINEYYSTRRSELAKLNKAIISSGIDRVFAAEFGFIEKPNIKKSISSKIYYKYLNLIKPYTEEVLFLENPSDMKSGKTQQVKGTFIEDIIKKLTSNNQ
jgi:hypothetical protein